MGTDLFKHYSFDKNCFLTLGNHDVWNIHRGMHKDRKVPVCLFAVDKKQLKKITKDKKDLIVLLKKEAANLGKIKHPNILGIAEPVAEDKNSLGFISERFSYSLLTWFDQTNPTKLEIKSFIIDLCKTMIFLHEDAHIIHNNLNLKTVLIDEMNRIKIASLGYACNDPPIGGIDFKADQLMMNMSFVAPEIVFDGKAYYSSDVYSIGAILYSLLKKLSRASDWQLITSSNTTIEDYKAHFSNSYIKISNSNFEQEDIDLLNKCLIKDHSLRPSMKELIEHKWFNDPKLKALHFIEHLEQNETAKNNEFLQKLPKILHMFENKIITKRFLPSLLLAVKSEHLLVQCIPSIFAISEKSDLKLLFEKDIWPSIKSVLAMKSIPASSLYFLLTKISFICDNVSSKEFSSTFLNVICKAMDCNVIKIQSVVSDNLITLAKKIESLNFKNQIYPRMINIMINTNSHSLKVQLLTCLKSLYTMLDQTIINDHLLSSLEKIKKNDNTSEVCMKIAFIYEEISKIVSVESIANKILPNLISIIVSGNISKKNFETLMQMIQKYLERIKKEREKDLADDETSTVDSSTNVSGNTGLGEIGIGSSSGGDKDDFLTSFFGSTTFFNSNSNNHTLNAKTYSDKEIGFDLGNIDNSKSKTENMPPIKSSKSFNMNTSNQPTSSNLPFTVTQTNKAFNSSSSSSTIGINNNIAGIPLSQPQSHQVNYNKAFEDFTKNPQVNNQKNKIDLDSLLNDIPSSQPITNKSEPTPYFNNPNDFNQYNLDFLKPKDINPNPSSNSYAFNMNTLNNVPSMNIGNKNQQMNFNTFDPKPLNMNINNNSNNKQQLFPSFTVSFNQQNPSSSNKKQNDLFDFNI